jgi:LacI family transcriptional regulator
VNANKRVAVVLGIDSAFGRELLRGINEYGRENGHWHLYFGNNPDIPMLPKKEDWDVDGIIIGLGTRKDYQEVEPVHVPIVNIGSAFEDLKIPSVRPDNEDIGRAAAEHLIARGLSNFACVTIADHAGAERRVRGFLSLVTAAGTSHRFVDAIKLRSRIPGEPDRIALMDWLRELPTPVGIMVFNDRYAQAVVEAARRINIRVPEEIALVSVDNDDLLCTISNPPLTSVDSAADRIGYRAAELLDSLMQGKKAPAAPILVPHRGVVPRRSSDVLALEDQEVLAAMRFIRQQPVEQLSIQAVLKVVNISRRTLERRFAQALGRTVYDEIRNRRIEQGKYMLSRTTLPVEQVAHACGFRHISHFSNAFASATGVRPRKFRTQTGSVI